MDDNKNIEVKKAFEGALEAENEQSPESAEPAGDVKAADGQKMPEIAGAAGGHSGAELPSIAEESQNQQNAQISASTKLPEMQVAQDSVLNGSPQQAAGQGFEQADLAPVTARDAWRRKLNKGTAHQNARQSPQAGGSVPTGQETQAGQSAQYNDAARNEQAVRHNAQHTLQESGNRLANQATQGSQVRYGQSAQYRSSAQDAVYSGGTYSYSMAGMADGGQGKIGNKKPFIIFGAILGGILLLAILFQLAGFNGWHDAEYLSGAETIHEDHIGVLYIEGAIMEGDATYNHAYALDAIDGMMENNDNEGLMLYVNTPGGGVYESDELYLKIKEYQDLTGRPVYAYLGSQATSGGYYISAPADKIAANRNCWTGSIGVTMGNLYDISGLLSKYGINVTTITSGANKAMGDMTAPLTDEQKQILQSLVDDAYDQFVGIVAEGRNLDEAYVRSISDGRLYTAKQAQSVHLIDDIVETYDDAIDDMMDEYELWDCEVYEFRYEPEYGLFGGLIQGMDRLAEAAGGNSDLNALAELMEGRSELPIQYMCEVTK